MAAGLLLGKPLGIFSFSWVSVRLGLCQLPGGVCWRQVLGAAMLGGIGFTMSLFITNLAYTDPKLINAAKMGIFLGSIGAGIGGYLLLSRIDRSGPKA